MFSRVIKRQKIWAAAVGRAMRMPSEADLPPGPVRDFVELLFYFFRLARRPALREISDLIKKNSELRGTASTETIRRMLHGATVPAHWETVEAVAVVLCQMARINLDNSEWEWEGTDGPPLEQVERLWHRALDEPDVVYRRARDPWDDSPF